MAQRGGIILKKFKILAVCMIAIVGVFFLLHRQFQSKSDTQYKLKMALNETESIEYENLKLFLKENPGKHVFFVKNGETDESYIESSLLEPLSIEFDNVITDVNRLNIKEANLSVVNLKKSLAIDYAPAFIYLETTDQKGNFNVLSNLSYDKRSPFDSNDLRTWFFENGLWNGPYGNK